MDIEPDLRDKLVCPRCHAPLRDDDATQELVCTDDSCGLAYPVRDGVLVLLIDEARPTRTPPVADADVGSG